MNGDIRYEIFTSGQVNIDYCVSCSTCMTRGFCPRDKNDDMGMLKEKMMEADFIIWGSPVYIVQVTAQMKTFLDRLRSWYHTVRLAGKPGMTVSTAFSPVTEAVHDYLALLLRAIGVKSIARLDISGTSAGIQRVIDEAKKKAEETALAVYPYIMGEKLFESDKAIEEIFQMLKAEATGIEKESPAIYEYWKENEMLKLDSFAQLLEKTRKEAIGKSK